MPISRNPRNDRRRRFLMDNAELEAEIAAKSRGRGRSQRDQQDGEANPRRSAGYSQDVRRACGQRLVQMIPVRKRSYAAAVGLSILLPATLMIFHYMIYVSGSLNWFGHPLVASLDMDHPNSIAAWLCSHMWLLCLGTTLLTFQLRRHKLDDYEGEYRLWFWMVVTCLVASVDATTHISDAFGLALNRWSQINLGWSGPAVVRATLAVMIGMLALRLCTELKSVPVSLTFWLGGIVAWAGSAALGQDELLLNISLQYRVWLKNALWLGGLTAVWLAALSYLRHVYIEAQRRFLARGRLAMAENGIPIRQRLRESIPNMPQFRRRELDEEGNPVARSWSMPSWRRNRDDSEEMETERAPRRKSRRVANEQELERRDSNHSNNREDNTRGRGRPTTEPHDATRQDAEQPESTRRGLGGFLRRGKSATEEQTPGRSRDEDAARRSDRRADREDDDSQTESTSGMFGWLKRGKDDDADEYKKVTRQERADEKRRRNEERKAERIAAKAQRLEERQAAADDDQEEGGRRSWFSRRNRDGDADATSEEQTPKRSWFSRRAKDTNSDSSADSRRDADDDQSPRKSWFSRRKEADEASDGTEKKKTGFFSRFKLQPPEDGDSDDGNSTNQQRDSGRRQNLPSTSRSTPMTDSDDYSDHEDRPLTKAERKRLRRQRQQDRAA